MKEMNGACFLYSETGTEGGYWAMQEDGFVAQDGHWRYEGLQKGSEERRKLTKQADEDEKYGRSPRE